VAKVELADDGSVVVQGEIIAANTYHGYQGSGESWVPSGEARVRVPVSVLRQAVLADALGYEITMGRHIYHVAPEDVRVIFPAAE